MTVDTLESANLRNRMVDQLIADQAAKGLTLPASVEAALRTVPRELYAPNTPLPEAYANSAIVTKRRGEESISSVSAPFLIAEMLGQAVDALDGLKGRHVLEIGSGGYNASLLAELVGPAGSVTTVDIDPEVTDRASACLAAAGYHDVKVVCADAEHPVEPGRRYDLIIVTAGAWDIPSAWREQLTDGGVLVVPLRTFGLTRSWALRRAGQELVSHSHRQCGFVSVQGAGAHEVRYLDIADGVHLRLDEDQQVDPAMVTELMLQPRRQAWAGFSLAPRTVLADLDLWLATRLVGEADEFVILTAQEAAVESGVVAPAWRFGTPATVETGAFCYRSELLWTGQKFDVGAIAHGPHASAAAKRMVEHMRAWVEASSPSPALRVFAAQTPDGDLPAGTVLDKRHSRLVLTFTPTEEKGLS
ncbi:methyltransferase, FxLD system [Actinomadura logoneensis]|uniref:Protein-L-isoaspartate O-methyltransferase n=1 Tax=Actinomadura logoneensis TaxID=2293572 RepID=A0A372JMR7_9ACTN|nr:methyltransferase, FxLD system [Actinomadura logoneensis]RFU41250.1 methyltransferase, FxLD system [Actinomadura logoneensis]